MKKAYLLLLIIPLFSFQNLQTSKDFIGMWEGESNNKVGNIIFEADGYATFIIEGQTIGGREFIMNGKKDKMTYTINSETSPIQIDFTVTKLESGESEKLLTIAEFIDDKTLKMAIEFKENRPTDFEGENSITLIKLK